MNPNKRLILQVLFVFLYFLPFSGFGNTNAQVKNGSQVREWKIFYEQVFDLKVDFTDLHIPAEQTGFDRLIIVAENITTQIVYDKCAELFLTLKYTGNNLDSIIIWNERNPKNGSYAIWVRDKVEPDYNLKYKSVHDIKELGINTETLMERLLHELKYYVETGRHLDIDNITLCVGSRISSDMFNNRNDGVPEVHWHDGYCSAKMEVYWYSGNARDKLRARQVISL